jgi:hypothetical protein
MSELPDTQTLATFFHQVSANSCTSHMPRSIPIIISRIIVYYWVLVVMTGSAQQLRMRSSYMGRIL